VSHLGFKIAKQSEDPDLFTITTFEFFEDKNHHTGYNNYILSTSFWLSIEPEELKCKNNL
jgi:hypothetical protein